MPREGLAAPLVSGSQHRAQLCRVAGAVREVEARTGKRRQGWEAEVRMESIGKDGKHREGWEASSPWSLRRVGAELGILPHAQPLVAPHSQDQSPHYPGTSPQILYFQAQIQLPVPSGAGCAATLDRPQPPCTCRACAMHRSGARTSCPVNSNSQLGPSQQQMPGLGAE